MPKINRCGQAALMSNSDYGKVRKQIRTEKYKVLLDLAWYTGERWGALVQLKVSDVYDRGRPKEVLIFPGIIRKHRPDGTADNVIIPVHENLSASLGALEHDGLSLWLFPSRCGTKP
ncbi:MAG: site-specific integrase, partial [Nostoc sp.]